MKGAPFGKAFTDGVSRCTDLGFFDWFADSMEPVCIDPYAYILWCARCVISRMLFGSLAPYHTPVPGDTFIYLPIRVHVHRLMNAPIFYNYRVQHSMVIQSLKEYGMASFPILPGAMSS